MKSIPALLSQCQFVFNTFIRLRDSEGCNHFKCISCGQIKSIRFMDAGHYYNMGYFGGLRFDEDNVHGQCNHCNRFLGANLIEYRNNLLFKIGIERFKALETRAGVYKRTPMKWSRFDLEFKIKEYKQKIKELNELYM